MSSFNKLWCLFFFVKILKRTSIFLFSWFNAFYFNVLDDTVFIFFLFFYIVGFLLCAYEEVFVVWFGVLLKAWDMTTKVSCSRMLNGDLFVEPIYFFINGFFLWQMKSIPWICILWSGLYFMVYDTIGDFNQNIY